MKQFFYKIAKAIALTGAVIAALVGAFVTGKALRGSAPENIAQKKADAAKKKREDEIEKTSAIDLLNNAADPDRAQNAIAGIQDDFALGASGRIADILGHSGQSDN